MEAGQDLDERLRATAFAYLDRLRARDGDRISYRDLEAFELEGQRVPLIQRMRGIRVVSGLEAALSILTTYAARPQDRPYEDTEGPDRYWRYKGRGTDPEGDDKRGPSAGHGPWEAARVVRGRGARVQRGS